MKFFWPPGQGDPPPYRRRPPNKWPPGMVPRRKPRRKPTAPPVKDNLYEAIREFLTAALERD